MHTYSLLQCKKLYLPSQLRYLYKAHVFYTNTLYLCLYGRVWTTQNFKGLNYKPTKSTAPTLKYDDIPAAHLILWSDLSFNLCRDKPICPVRLIIINGWYMKRLPGTNNIIIENLSVGNSQWSIITYKYIHPLSGLFKI